MSAILPPYLLYLLAFVSAFILCVMAIPQIILIASKKHLFDMPDNDRKLHLRIVPNLGGVGIFFAYVIVASIFTNPVSFYKWNYIVASTLLLFLTGIMDDLVSLSPAKKFFAQFAAAIIMVVFAGIRLESLHGIFGIYQLPAIYSIGFSVVGCIFITNAFNLIDGIDGLAGTISALCTFLLGVCLALTGYTGAACMSFALMGAIVGFLRYNISPARIFMGDTGSLVIGFTISILCIAFINGFDSTKPIVKYIHTPKAALVVGLSILFVPVFDSFRVFITRVVKGGSPFRADRTHLHHYLLDLGFTHSRTVTILVTANILIITLSLLVQDYNPNIAIGCLLAFTFGLFAILYYMRKNRLAAVQKKELEASNGHLLINGDGLQTPTIFVSKPNGGVVRPAKEHAEAMRIKQAQ